MYDPIPLFTLRAWKSLPSLPSAVAPTVVSGRRDGRHMSYLRMWMLQAEYRCCLDLPEPGYLAKQAGVLLHKLRARRDHASFWLEMLSQGRSSDHSSVADDTTTGKLSVVDMYAHRSMGHVSFDGGTKSMGSGLDPFRGTQLSIDLGAESTKATAANVPSLCPSGGSGTIWAGSLTPHEGSIPL